MPRVAADVGREIGWLRDDFLPTSETFIHTGLVALDRYHARVFSLHRHSLNKFPYDEVIALADEPWGRVQSLLYRALAWSPAFARWARGVALVHTHMGFSGVHGLMAARRSGVPCVTSFYGRDVTLRSVSPLAMHPIYWPYRLLAPVLFAHGDRFLVLSRHMQAALVAQGCPEHKLRVVPLAVDVDRFAHERTARRTRALGVLMVGREVDKKGFDDGLRACAEAREQGADVRVVVLGTGGPLRGELQRLADSLALDVAWPDPSTRVAAAMAEADVLLVPSRTAADGDQEGTPTVICEGSAARLPIVATRHAGIPEQVDDGITGLLADERDHAIMAAHLVRLAGDPELRVALGRAGHDKMKREYDVAVLRDNLQAVYDELLGAERPRKDQRR